MVFFFLYEPSNLWFELQVFSPALSSSQQQAEETSFHSDSENTDFEKRSLPDTELTEKKQPVEYGNVQMRNGIQINRQKFLSVAHRLSSKLKASVLLMLAPRCLEYMTAEGGSPRNGFI